MIGTVVTPMERGQITLPKPYRDQLGITVGMPLNVTIEGERIVIEPLVKVIENLSRVEIRPCLSKGEYLSTLRNIKGVLWTKSDDAARKLMKEKEKRW